MPIPVLARHYLAHTKWQFGDLQRARAERRGESRAAQSAHVPTLLNAYLYRALFEILRGDANVAARAAEASSELSQEHGPCFLAVGQHCRGVGRVRRLGDREIGVTELREA